jgi:hypothetical protein
LEVGLIVLLSTISIQKNPCSAASLRLHGFFV